MYYVLRYREALFVSMGGEKQGKKNTGFERLAWNMKPPVSYLTDTFS